jgi:hypothetical protein
VILKKDKELEQIGDGNMKQKKNNPVFSILFAVFVAAIFLGVSAPLQNSNNSDNLKTTPHTHIIHNF